MKEITLTSSEKPGFQSRKKTKKLVFDSPLFSLTILISYLDVSRTPAMRQTVEKESRIPRLCSHLANLHFNLTQQNVCSIHDVPDDGQQKQQRRDEAAKHIWFVLSKILAILVELLAFALEFFGDVNCVVRVECSVDPCDIDR
jgi:hypothetical protein